VPAATATPTPLDPALAKKLRDIEDRVIQIRGLARPRDVPSRFVNQEQMDALIEEEITDAEAVESFQKAERLYKLLGLIPQDAGLLDLYRRLLGAEVLGLYDDEKEEFFVLQRGTEFGAAEETTYAHEYVHRLQDAYFDLTALLKSSKGADPATGAGPSERESAIAALVEGDAVNVQSLYMLRYINLARMAELLRLAAEAGQATADIPYVLSRGLEFPYNEGSQFVTRLQAAGGRERVDAAFKSPPETTEQVLHPEKFLAGEGPKAVPVPGEGLLGVGWTSQFADSFGEFFLRTWLEALGAGAAAGPAAAGWGGDAFRLYAGPGGRSALVGVIVWDSGQSDAAEFFNTLSGSLTAAERFERLVFSPGGPVSFWQGPGGVVAVALAQAQALPGTATVIAVAPDAGLAVQALGALASG
jgi:hypothetical protein